MRTSFLIVFNRNFATQEKVTDFLDEIGPDWDWHAPFSNCVFFTSPLSAQELATKFEAKFGTDPGKLFLISEIGKSKQGRLWARGWRVLQNPENPRAK